MNLQSHPPPLTSPAFMTVSVQAVPLRIQAGLEAARGEVEAHCALAEGLRREVDAARSKASTSAAAVAALQAELSKLTSALAEARVAQAASALTIVELEGKLAGRGDLSYVTTPAAAASAVTPLRQPSDRPSGEAARETLDSAARSATSVAGTGSLLELLACAAARGDTSAGAHGGLVACSEDVSVGAKRKRPDAWGTSESVGE